VNLVQGGIHKVEWGFLSSVGRSGLVGQGIVYLLFVLSIYLWAIIFYKNAAIRRARRESRNFLEEFRGDPDGMINHYADPRKLGSSPFAKIMDAALEELALVRRPRGRSGSSGGIAPTQIDGIDRCLERAISEQIIGLRSQLIVLATTAGGAPFVGLFGTVWGILNAFESMSVTGSASISSVAPGVSAALTTTVAGLAVAIPALVAYNYFMNAIRDFTTEMENFSSEILSTIERGMSGDSRPARGVEEESPIWDAMELKRGRRG
jgi:biopolymer transport protein TolQ